MFKISRENEGKISIKYAFTLEDVCMRLENFLSGSELKNAENWCRKFWKKKGSKLVRKAKGYRIDCLTDEDAIKYIQNNVLKAISDQSGVSFEFYGKDSSSYIFDASVGASYISYNDDFGFHLAIILVEEDNTSRTVREYETCDTSYLIYDASFYLSKLKSNKRVKSAQRRETIDSWSLKSKGTKYDDARRAKVYVDKFGIVNYRMEGHYLVYNESFKTNKWKNGKLVPSSYTVQHRVDVRDYTETHKLLKRTDKNAFDNVRRR